MKPTRMVLYPIFISIFIVFYYIASTNYYFSLFLFPRNLPYDTKRILELAALLLSLLTLLSAFKIRQRCLSLFFSLPISIRFACGGIFALGIASSLLAPLPKMALMKVALYTCLFFFTFFIGAMRLIWKEQFSKWVVNLLLIAIGCYLMYFFFDYFISLKAEQPLIVHYLAPGFSNIRLLAHYLIWTLPVILIPFAQPKLSDKKMVTLIIIALGWWFLFWVESSKGLVIAYSFSLLLTFCLFRKPAYKTLLICLCFSASGFILYWFGFYLPEHHVTSAFSYSPIHRSIHERLFLLKLSWHYIKMHPWLGLGPLHFAYYINPIAAGPSNGYLTLPTQWGTPAGLLFLFILIYGVKRWVPFAKNEGAKKPELYSLSLCFFASLIYLAVSGLLNGPSSQLLMCIIIGWMIGCYFDGKKLALTKKRHRALWIIPIAAMTALIWIVPPQLHNLTKNEIQWLYQHPNHKSFQPQFWSQGWLQ